MDGFVTALHSPYDRRPEALPHADRLARLVGLDMTHDWTPTAANYFGRVTKGRILTAVREAKGEDTARLLEGLKKGDMAREAERLMAGSGWLPDLMRTPGLDAEGPGVPAEVPQPEAFGSQDGEALPDFLAGDGDEAGEGGMDVEAYRIAAE